MDEDPAAQVGHAAGDRIGPERLYALLTLRVDVFVVEQHAPYRELDGADVRATTTHLWIDRPLEPGEDGGAAAGEPAAGPPVAGAGRRLLAGGRLLAAGDDAELGRVVVAAAHRGRGLGAAVVRAGCRLAGRPLHVNAQAHLEGWYAGFGFATHGAAFDWEGISHVPMRLTA